MSGHALWSAGIDLEDDGSVSFTRLRITDASAGPLLDATLYHATACGVSVGGLGYQVNDQVHPTGFAGVIQIDSVAGNGAVLSCSWLKPACALTNPATVATSGGSGDQTFVATVTWALSTQLQIGATVNTLVGSGAAIATNSTTKMLLIPTCAGTPTGTVGGAGGAALIVDQTNHKLYFNDGGGWVAVN